MNQGIENRLRRLEDHPRFRGGLARMSDEALDAAIMDILRMETAPYHGDVAALVDALNASGDYTESRLAERIVWMVGVWQEEGMPAQ